MGGVIMNGDNRIGEVGRQTPAKGVMSSADVPTILFCTVCAKDRAAWLSQAEVKATLHELWRTEADAWVVGPYVLMPDHLHLLCCPRNPREIADVERWITFWKSRFSKKVQRTEWRWQRGVFHTRMRSDAHYREKVDYIRDNPVEKGLVQRADDWPWRGVVHDLEVQIHSFGQPTTTD
jgi:putative transposase